MIFLIKLSFVASSIHFLKFIETIIFCVDVMFLTFGIFTLHIPFSSVSVYKTLLSKKFASILRGIFFAKDELFKT